MKHTFTNEEVQQVVSLGGVIEKKPLAPWMSAIVFEPHDGSIEVSAQNAMGELAFRFRKDSCKEAPKFAVSGRDLSGMIATMNPQEFSIEHKTAKNGSQYCLVRIGGSTTKIPCQDDSQIMRRAFTPESDLEAPSGELLSAIQGAIRISDPKDERTAFSGVNVFDYNENLHVAGLSDSICSLFRLHAPGNLLDIVIPRESAVAISAMGTGTSTRIEQAHNALRISSGPGTVTCGSMQGKVSIRTIEKLMFEAQPEGSPEILVPRSTLLEAVRMAGAIGSKFLRISASDGRVKITYEDMATQKGGVSQVSCDGDLEEFTVKTADVKAMINILYDEKITIRNMGDKTKPVYFLPSGEMKDSARVVLLQFNA